MLLSFLKARERPRKILTIWSDDRKKIPFLEVVEDDYSGFKSRSATLAVAMVRVGIAGVVGRGGAAES